MLYDNSGYRGRTITVDHDIPNLHLPEIRFGDSTRSLKATGRWELCKDINYRGDCRIFEGSHHELPGFSLSVSSLRYLDKPTGELVPGEPPRGTAPAPVRR